MEGEKEKENIKGQKENINIYIHKRVGYKFLIFILKIIAIISQLLYNGNLGLITPLCYAILSFNHVL